MRLRSREDTQTADNLRLSGGFPHSDIPGSKGALASPGLIAECHVLHRLLLPRHPPNALIALDPIQKKTGPFAWQRFKLPTRPRVPVSEVFDPTAPPRQGTLRLRAPTGPGGPDEAHGQCVLDLERLSLAAPCRPAGETPTSTGHRTRCSPTRETSQERLVFCSLHDVNFV